ncbi:hypothetical protein FB567DRAFT_345838 [Paraphoma chrysanthemicola]|uniref:Protein kinase domain-containing protein n=1 Tax=Paraphoma chrysanthemicola TaxID=798071 RepID=A0A8K0R8H9_9PLEO|nr:hypothetical protein FB567DRAFT_345838 [Paraphoma chrysanthemicola]
MGRPFLTSIPHKARRLHHFRYRVALITFLAIFSYQQYLFHIYRQALAEKYSSTEFGTTDCSSCQQNWSLETDTNFQLDLLRNRDKWTVLGEGWEGKVFLYGDYVIKTFTPGRSPLRNCAPGLSDTWPTEIAASQWFNPCYLQPDDQNRNQSRGNSIVEPAIGTALNGLVPVKAYFRAPTPHSAIPEWHLVTHFVKDGSLTSLSRTIGQNCGTRTYQQLDAEYRTIFESMVNNLGKLHQAGFCHDDIKPGNIFVNGSNWLLGDLGNLRHVAHPYHFSRIWRENEQLEDCRANDIMRALKSYIQFIRDSAADSSDFDEDFIAGQEPIPRLFRSATRTVNELSATELQHLSHIFNAKHVDIPLTSGEIHKRRQRNTSRFFLGRLAQKVAVDRAIRTRIGEKLARFYAITWLFGVPVPDSCHKSVPRW